MAVVAGIRFAVIGSDDIHIHQWQKTHNTNWGITFAGQRMSQSISAPISSCTYQPHGSYATVWLGLWLV